MRFAVVLLAGFSLAASSCGGGTVHRANNDRPVASATADSAQVNGCLSRDDVAARLYAMATAKSSEAADPAKDALLNESRRSASCRASLIESIVNTMGEPHAVPTDDGTHFNVWRAGAGLLA